MSWVSTQTRGAVRVMTLDNPGRKNAIPRDGWSELGAALAEFDKQLAGRGTVRSVMADHGMIELDHEPIPALEWPAMTMTFDVVEGVELDAIEPGQTLGFTLLEQDGDYLIESLTVDLETLGQPAANEEQ